LAPYMLMASAGSALIVSVVATILALAVFGAVKGHYTGMPLASGALRTAFIGGLAAAAAFGIARLVSGGK
jgi:VIT1/CCC1 family predicted Fe2+/Mn2+ transporter